MTPNPLPLLAAAGLVAAAVLVAAPGRGRRQARRRQMDLLGRPTRLLEGTHPSGPASASRRTRVDRVRLAAVLGGISVAMLVGNWGTGAGGGGRDRLWVGVLAGAVLAVVLDRLLRRLEPAARRRERLAEAAALPLAADLLAVTLRGGAPVDRAVAAVAEALPGPLGDRLGRVGRALGLGATPAQAWAELVPVPDADRLIRAAVRSAEHGSALAAALGRLADDLRADSVIAADAAARRAAVLIVLPLGLCFLPAFVLAGLVPVIIAVLGDVL